MAGISLGHHGHKKSVDHEIPLIPFIDLLLVCVMFLLVTAVWNQLARLNANQQKPGQEAALETPLEESEKDQLFLHIAKDTGFTLFSTEGESQEIPKLRDAYDLLELKTKLQNRRKLDPNRTDIIVTSDDGVVYREVVAAMDIVLGEGFKDMALDVKTTVPAAPVAAQ